MPIWHPTPPQIRHVFLSILESGFQVNIRPREVNAPKVDDSVEAIIGLFLILEQFHQAGLPVSPAAHLVHK